MHERSMYFLRYLGMGEKTSADQHFFTLPEYSAEPDSPVAADS